MNSPKISVVMAVYNEERFLDESMQSILNQTFKDFEFIIVNDGSTDNSLKIIKKYAKKDKRIVVINSLKNERSVKTRNKALIAAKGKYIADLDADDVAAKQRLEVQYDYLETHPNIFLVGSSTIVIGEDGEKIGVFRKYDNAKKIKKKLEKTNCIVLSSIMFRNKGFLYREKFESTEDYDLYSRILTSGYQITNLPQFLTKYRLREGSISRTKQTKQFLLFLKAKEFYQQRKKYGRDNYDVFDASEIFNKKDNQSPAQNLVQAHVIAGFQAGYMKQVRKDIKILIKKKGLSKNLLMYYVFSWIPIKLTWFIKSKIL